MAGLLVLLYAQTAATISELTVDHITTTDTDTYLALHEQPVLLPPPLATLTTQLTAQNRQREQTTSRSGTPGWLFPGARAGAFCRGLDVMLEFEQRPWQDGGLYLLAGRGGLDAVIVRSIRLPRVLLAGVVGGMLALAGAAYQGVFANPLADPYLLGAASGAELGATSAIAYAPVAFGVNVVPVFNV